MNGRPGTASRTIACALVIFCVFAGVAGAGSSRLTPPLHWGAAIHVGHSGISALSCPSTTLCVAGSPDGLLVSTDPSGGASSWKLVFTPPSSGNMAPQINSVSCPSTAMCVAASGAGDLVTSSDPSGGPSAWTLTPLHIPVGSYPHIFVPQVSCATPTLCVAISTGSRSVFSSTDPTGGVGAWKSAKLKRPAETLACTHPHLCVLGDDHGDVRTSENPTGGAGTWTFAHIFGKPGYTEDLTAAACGSATWCMIEALYGGGDTLIQASRPTGTTPRTPGVWQAQVAGGRMFFESGACVGRFCAYSADNGYVYYPTGSYRTLTKSRVSRPGRLNTGSVSCASRDWCGLGTFAGNFYIGQR